MIRFFVFQRWAQLRHYFSTLHGVPLCPHPTSRFRILLLPHERRLSFFSFFSSKPKGETETSEASSKSKTEAEASQSWLEALRTFEQYELLDMHQTTKALTRSESRRLKKKAFLHTIRTYLTRHGKTRRGFNQFALNALNRMPEYEVQDDLECYKAIIELFPPGRMKVTTFLQAEWNHFPRQQGTMIQIMKQMTENHVLPDDEVGQMIINVFGWRNHAMQHYRHLMYWMPKLSNVNPWPVLPRIVDELDENPIYLTQLIAERICPDRATKFQLVKLNARDTEVGQPSSMVSAQSPEQQALLSYFTSSQSFNESGPGSRSQSVIYLDGPHFVWYRTLQAAYYTLWTELDQKRFEKERIRVERREKWITHKSLADLPQLGHSALPIDRQLDPVPTLPDNQCRDLRLVSAIDTEVNKSVILDPKNALAVQGNAHLTTLPPEYDNRWIGMRRSHQYRFLPNELTSHEQAEGTILAIGVVTPMQDALDNQKHRFALDGPMIESTDSLDSRNLPLVPKPAPAQLLRMWLTKLQESNPGLAHATLVMRNLNYWDFAASPAAPIAPTTGNGTSQARVFEN